MTPNVDKTTKILDRMVLYQILHKYIDEKGQTRYHSSEGFKDFIRIVGEGNKALPELAQVYGKMSDMEFVQFVLLPRYLAAAKVTSSKRATLPEYQKRVNSIEVSQNEINEESEKILDYYCASDQKMYELEYMAKVILGELILNLRKIRGE